MKDPNLDRIQGVIERHIKDCRVTPIDLAAACAFMALSQAVTFGNKVRSGELDAKDVPTSAPAEAKAMLKDDPEILTMFQQIGSAIYSVAAVGNRTLTFAQTKGIFNLNLGASEVVEKNPRLGKALDEIGYTVADGASVRKVALATVWYWMFHRYNSTAKRFDVREASLAEFQLKDEIPVNVAFCIWAIWGDKELATLIPN